MADIFIIGGLGIGKAHAVAAIKAGHKVTYVADVIHKLQQVYDCYNNDRAGRVVNEWGFIKEEAQQEDEIQVISLDAVGTIYSHLKPPDLAIIAAPDLEHSYWAHTLKGVRIIVEKPALIAEWDYTPLTYVGYEWLNHSKFKPPCRYAFMFHQWPPTHRPNNIITDLGSHLLSLMQDYEEAELIYSDDSIIVFKKGDAYGIGAYVKSDNMDRINCMDKSLKQWALLGVDLIIDDQAMVWEEDLFGKQINAVLEDKEIVKNAQAYYRTIDKTLLSWLITPKRDTERENVVKLLTELL